METKHTKGEWVNYYNGYYFEVRGKNKLTPNISIFTNLKIDSPNIEDENICEYDEAEANAKLIAASPLMYEYINEMAKNGCKKAKKILSKLN